MVNKSRTLVCAGCGGFHSARRDYTFLWNCHSTVWIPFAPLSVPSASSGVPAYVVAFVLTFAPTGPRLTVNLRPRYTTHIVVMPKKDMPAGALVLLILKVLRSGPLHGYAIAQRIHTLSSEVLHVEEGALYPALQRILLKGWVTAEWGISETNRKVRFYRLTRAGRKQLEAELSDYGRVHDAIQAVLRTA